MEPGHNRKLMETGKTLQDYTEYTSRVRTYAAEMSLDEAVERAITECIREKICENKSPTGSELRKKFRPCLRYSCKQKLTANFPTSYNKKNTYQQL